MRRLVGFLAIVAVGSTAIALAPADAVAAPARPRDIVLIVTDDQTTASLRWMPTVQRALVGRGTTFTDYVISDPLCCPSRVSMLTGRYAHTTGVWANRPPDGGWESFDGSGLESSTIAVALDDVGYRTALLGKYMNGYAAAGSHVPAGWDRWFAFRSPAYFDYEVVEREGPADEVRIQRFGTRPRNYSTDVLATTAADTIRSTGPRKPLFLVIAPKAPHVPVTPAPRHAGTFRGEPIGFGRSVNERRVGDKPPYIRDLATLDDDALRRLARMERDRAEALLAVDELVARVLGALRSTGRLDGALIVFTSDNGYLVGEHRYRGKGVPYEESITVPLIVRQGGSTEPRIVSRLAANVDLAATFAEIGGAPFASDGVSLMPLLDGRARVRSSVILESPGVAHRPTPVPAYCGIRTPRYTFVRYVDGFEELYDLVRDPSQMQNRVSIATDVADELRARARAGCDPVPPGFGWG